MTNKNLVVIDAKKTFEQAYTDYSAFVIQRRSTPDVRDGFKFTQRQIMYSQFINKLRFKDKRQKSLKTVGAAMSHSYVHGDSSCYSVIIHLVRPFYTRYNMQDFKGAIMMTGSKTYGSMRYTETRLSPLSEIIFKYIKENGITEKDWNPTFDEESEYPTLFPSIGYYNICNGSFGSIGVGIASSIPQFNMREINSAICELIDDPSVEVNILPDFSSHGVLINPQTTLKSLSKGEGRSALLRGKIVKNPKGGYLSIKSLPYGVYTDTICNKIAKNMETSKLITDFKDLSQDAVDIRVYGSNLDAVEEWLYKNTLVQNHFTINMVMLDEGKTPKIFSLKAALLAHIKHASAAYERQYRFQLTKLELRQEIIEGLIRAQSIIDEVVKCIKGSISRADAIDNLVNQFQFSARVSEAIVELKLHRLTSLDIQKLHEELQNNLTEQARILNVLNNKELFNEELKAIYRETAEKFGDARKTSVYEGEEFETDAEGESPTRDYYMTYSPTHFWADNNETSELFEAEEGRQYEKTPTDKLYIDLDDQLIILSNTGRVFLREAKEIKLGFMHWSEILPLKKGETIMSLWKKGEVTEFIYIDDKEYHSSFITCAASKRGKKFKPGTWDIKKVRQIEPPHFLTS